jgi:hypothetical protein
VGGIGDETGEEELLTSAGVRKLDDMNGLFGLLGLRSRSGVT